jgi:predicted nucleic acid-binding protein
LILLGTNLISAVKQRQPEAAVVSWLDQQSLLDLWLPSVVVFELRDGVAILPDSRCRRTLEEGFGALLGQLIRDRIAPLDGPAARRAAGLAADRRASGRTVDLRDTLIAGIALARVARLATRNTRHFDDTTIGLIHPFTGSG